MSLRHISFPMTRSLKAFDLGLRIVREEGKW